MKKSLSILNHPNIILTKIEKLLWHILKALSAFETTDKMDTRFLVNLANSSYVLIDAVRAKDPTDGVLDDHWSPNNKTPSVATLNERFSRAMSTRKKKNATGILLLPPDLPQAEEVKDGQAPQQVSPPVITPTRDDATNWTKTCPAIKQIVESSPQQISCFGSSRDTEP